MSNAVILKANGDGLVAPHSTSGLLLTGGRHDGCTLTLSSFVKLLHDPGASVLFVVFAAAALCRLNEPAGDVDHPTTGGIFLVVLASGAFGAVVPFDPEVFGRTLGVSIVDDDIHIEDSDNHRARVNTPTFFGWGHALHTMSAGFVFQFGEVFAFDFEGDLKIARVRWAFPNDAVLSTLAGEETQVCVREVFDEKLAVSPTFRRTDFDGPLHWWFLLWVGLTRTYLELHCGKSQFSGHPVPSFYHFEPFEAMRNFPHTVYVQSRRVAKPNESLRALCCFHDDFIVWMEDNPVDDCFYSIIDRVNDRDPKSHIVNKMFDGTIEFVRGRFIMKLGYERFFLSFNFKSQRDAILFKTFWAE